MEIIDTTGWSYRRQPNRRINHSRLTPPAANTPFPALGGDASEAYEGNAPLYASSRSDSREQRSVHSSSPPPQRMLTSAPVPWWR